MQCEQGALYSFRKAESNLEKLTVHRRSVNNHTNIQLITHQVGAVLAAENLQLSAVVNNTASAAEVILQVDGGHIPTKDKDKRSFEALYAVAYRPENLIPVDNHHGVATEYMQKPARWGHNPYCEPNFKSVIWTVLAQNFNERMHF